MVDMKQRKRQVGHEFKSFAFWYVHSFFDSFIWFLPCKRTVMCVEVVPFEAGQRHLIVIGVFF